MKFSDRVNEVLAIPLRPRLNIVKHEDSRVVRTDHQGGGVLFRRVVCRLGAYGGGIR